MKSNWSYFFFVGVFGGLCFSSSALKAETVNEVGLYSNIKRGFSSDILYLNERSGESSSGGRVILTKYGTKVFAKGMFGDSENGVYIQNFSQDRSWLIRPARQVYAELQSENESHSDENIESTTGLALGSALMSTERCFSNELSLDSESVRVVGEAIVAGYNVEVWLCELNEGTVEHYFSSRLGLVIRERWPNGDIATLKNVKEVDLAEAHFYPPAKYSEIKLAAFYGAATELEPY